MKKSWNSRALPSAHRVFPRDLVKKEKKEYTATSQAVGHSDTSQGYLWAEGGREGGGGWTQEKQIPPLFASFPGKKGKEKVIRGLRFREKSFFYLG